MMFKLNEFSAIFKEIFPHRLGEFMRSSGYTTPRSRTNRSTKTTGLSIQQTILLQPSAMALVIISIPNIIWLYRVDVKRRLNAPYQKEQVHVSSASSHSDTFSCLESTCEAAEGSEAGGVRRSNGQCHQQVFKDCCFVVTRIHYYKRTSCSGNKDWKTWTGSSKSWRSTTSLFLKR